ncbi:hypothetical protein OFR42_06185 [Brachyspira hyodysenteriae]|nr:hypothetical protein [Brachyspira hyodysenteriae]MCZ9890939.1 hypothetical protein [Brachyspira hyodysenteriae]MDA0000283.1 hypothetical protein [Brachyspira hyodysenteriae]MDA0040253.1 hypothetical protein [Brachyspira hyodysenteriae]
MSDEQPKVSFIEKNPRTCPVCRNEFYHEMLLTGGGKVNCWKIKK